MNDLKVTAHVEEREGDAKPVLHLVVEAYGETAEEIQKAVDYVNSMREDAPRPEATDDK
jgi:hypothetical protein